MAQHTGSAPPGHRRLGEPGCPCIEAEFDRYASGYCAGMDHPIKRVVGRTADDFIEVKVRWLLRDLVRSPLPERDSRLPIRILDYGCGTGAFLKHLRRNRVSASLHGCDVSSAMLDEAYRSWTTGPVPKLELIADGCAAYADASFDIAILSSVLHHVAPSERRSIFEAISRILAPQGRLYVFEHNPFNPVTRWVVSHTAIDTNAYLLTPAQVRAHADKSGLIDLRTNYLLFFPPRWRCTRPLEYCLTRIPLGGQFMVCGTKPAATQPKKAP